MLGFATKLEKILHERGIKQSELARRINVDKSLVNKWVKGRHTPSAYFMTKIAHELKLTEQELFFDNEFNSSGAGKGSR